jgi:ribonuclease III
VNEQFMGRGHAKSKKQAEQLAARAFFEQLKNYQQ